MLRQWLNVRMGENKPLKDYGIVIILVKSEFLALKNMNKQEMPLDTMPRQCSETDRWSDTGTS